MARFQKHAERFNTQMIFDHIHTTHLNENRFVWSATRANTPATRSSSRPAHRRSIWAHLPKKHSAVAYPPARPDGFFYRNKPVAVVGGGNTAVEEALYLSKHRQPCHRGSPPRQLPRRTDFGRPHDGKVKEGKITLETKQVLTKFGDASGVTGAFKSL